MIEDEDNSLEKKNKNGKKIKLAKVNIENQKCENDNIIKIKKI